MCGDNEALIRQLPDTKGMISRFVMQSGHLVDYGHPIEQDVRLAGAEVVVAGSADTCSRQELDTALDGDGVAGLVLVQSRLCSGDMVPPAQAIAMAHEKGLPVILDAAAQDLVMNEMLALGADVTLFSAQKYLSSATAGLVLGQRELVSALSLQETGIGRGMKATKEAIIGALVAVEQRNKMDMKQWAGEQKKKAEYFARYISRLAPLSGEIVADPIGNPFYRVQAIIDPEICDKKASEIAARLATSDPVLIVQDHDDINNRLTFEIVHLDEQDIEIMVSLMAVIVFNRPPSGMRRRNIED
jgi:uncharacterized pyridoxal phosphate-dependent enzyme